MRPDPILRYTDEVRLSLAFDRLAADRLAAEAEDHLCEALADDPDGASDAAARRAIGRFGSAQEIAAAYTRETFPARLMSAWRLAVAPALLIAFAMQLRRVFGLESELGALPGADALQTLDSVAFRAALLVALAVLVLRLTGRADESLSVILQALIAGTWALALSAGAGLLIALGAIGVAGLSQATLLPVAVALLACALLLFLARRLRVLAGYAGLLGPPPAAR